LSINYFQANNKVGAVVEAINHFRVEMHVYSAARLSELGVSIREFLDGPQEALERVGQGEAMKSLEKGFLPLLPAQARVALRIARNGA
jgi:hypothetical protein